MSNMDQYSAQQYQATWPTTPELYSDAADRPKTAPVNVAQLFQDEGVRRASVTRKSGLRKADYRPASLRWWYLSSLIAVLVALIGVVVYANLALQGSDTTAKIQTRTVKHHETWSDNRDGLQGLDQRQNKATQVNAIEPRATGSTQDEPAGEEDDEIVSGGPSNEADEGTLTTAFVEVPINFTSTGPPITETFTTTTVSVITSDVVTTTVQTIPGSAVTLQPTAHESYGSSSPSETAHKVYFDDDTTRTLTITTQIEASVTTDVVVTTTKPGEEYIKLGKTTIFSTFTVDRNGLKMQNSVTKILTSEIGGTVVTSLETLPPILQVTVGPDGAPTTSTIFPAPITHTSSVPGTKTVLTVTSTPTGGSDPLIIVESREYNLGPAEVFMGKFLPPLVAVIVALAVRAVDMTAKLYQPFATLSHPRGASGKDSLTLHFEGWKGFWRPFGMVSKGHPVPLLSTLAVWLSTALAPVACEAIGLKLHGSCKSKYAVGCALGLGVSPLESYVLLGLMATVVGLLLALFLIVSRSWKTGVFADPWCLAGAASLCRNPDIRSLVALDYKAIKAATSEMHFGLGWFRNGPREEYGIVICDDQERSLRGSRPDECDAMMVETSYSESARYPPTGGNPYSQIQTHKRAPSTFAALTIWWRLLFLIYLVALTSFIMYYHLGFALSDKLEQFLEEERFGVRFASSTLGVIVILCWECIFDSVAILAPYRRMANKPQGATRSVLAKRPTYAVTGIFAGLRHRDPLLFGVSTMAVLSDFLPMLFANVPYDLTLTQGVHVVCARTSAGVLVLMAAVLIASMFASWPTFPVDPRSIAGEMWYVAESRWTEKMEGTAVMTERERKVALRDMGGRWCYGVIQTSLGDREAVEMDDTYGVIAYSEMERRPTPLLY
ncbi:uncharacterized protein J7T54_001519 [Emericellopsis cladophorae]|uniref:Uncharacterized protein n=1 Tax=Emericellopsis cladophorae TaxID=2686198 RepID=A0A9Q0BBI7_9HYPO|nr:uncharacterized protein J7T54_001519 [Emericellopsis cladophorae]KAI6778099.1 hypothetical protein J7T54_001519 [Emericellopsis cladophorae]